MKIKIEDIIIWAIIGLMIAIAIWKLIGSPTDTAVLISIILFISASEILIWRKLFLIEKNSCINIAKIDKNVSLSFMKMKNTMNKRFSEVNNSLYKIQTSLSKKK